MLRIEKLELNHYKRIYNGLGVKSLKLDFTGKDIIRLVGNNGTGKSTILNALSPFPDPPSEYMSTRPMDGGKKLYIRDENIMYEILYFYNGTSNVASIKKYPVNHPDLAEELVPSKNVSAAKEIIYSLFNLDSSFETLTLMNGYGKKSLAYMRPAERKVFVTSLLNNLGAYNAMYKTLCKRSSIFKAMINDINAKIINIGDSPDRLAAEISNLSKQIEDLNKKREDFIKRLGVIDLSDEEITKNQQIKRQITDSYKRIDEIEKKMFTLSERWGDIAYQLDYEANINKVRLDNFQEDLFGLQRIILGVKGDVDKFEKERDMLMTHRQMLLDKKRFIEASSEFIEYNKFQAIYSDLNISDIKEFLLFFANKYPDLKDQDIKFMLNDIDFKLFITQFQRLLTERCMLYDMKIDRHNLHTHGIIDQEYEYNQHKVLEYKRDLYNELMLHPNKSDTIIESLECIDLAIMNINDLKRRDDIDFKLWTLMKDYKFDSADVITKILKISFIPKFEYNGKFDIEEASKFYDDVLLYNTYRQYIEKDEQYTKGQEGEKIRELQVELKNISDCIQNTTDNIKDLNETIKIKKSVLEEDNEKLRSFNLLKEIISNYDKLNQIMTQTERDLEVLKASYVDVSDCAYYKEEVKKIDQLIKQSQDALYRYRYSLDLINEYMMELDDFKGKHSYVETIKKHCSPSTGIQLIFVDLYMNQILKTANFILKSLFGGEFILQPFIINENEFRIPVQGDGLLIDDISSMSASQIAMINMAVSFAILENTSSKYKIIRLDEIDSPLDSTNRAVYPQIVSTVMNILGSSQCFLVSHNEEFSGDDFKTIHLQKGVSDYK